MVSFKDIANLTGLSYGTISNVLNKRKGVKEENIRKVQDAVAALDYRVNYQARALASDCTKLIGLITSNTNDVADSSMLMPLETFAEQIGSRVIWSTSRNDKEREKRNCEALLSSKVDVLFVFFQFLENEEYFRHLANTEKTPIIFLGRYLDKCKIPYVAVDNEYAATQMVNHVYSLGHRELVYLDIAESAMLSPNKTRRTGVIDRCKKLGMKYSVINYPKGKEDISVGYKAAEEFIKNGNMPKLVFPRDDSFAVGFYNACVKHGVKVPEDVSIMSFGNFYSERMTPKRLSTFDRRFDLVVQKATQLYLDIKESRENGIELDVKDMKLFIRGSLIEGETVLNMTK